MTNALHVPLDVPPRWLAPTVAALREPAILESGPGFGPAGRWSIFAAEPRLVFEADDHGWTWRDGHGEQAGTDDPLDRLAAILAHHRLADPRDEPDPDAPPFQGGLIGYFGYDLAPRLERLPRRAVPDSGFPVLRFGLYDTVITHDRAARRATFSAYAMHGEGPSELDRRWQRWRRALEQPFPSDVFPPVAGPITSNFTPGAYREAVGRALEYIRAGDIFQVNLSQRFVAPGRLDPLSLYRRSRIVSPAPFAALLAWNGLAIVSASPESFYETRGDRIVTRPIKGTRPRGFRPEEDARLKGELAASPKDRAELTMIVDLERNDLGRVCRYGSVRVTEPLAVETFAQVHHLVATVEGRLRPLCGPIDVVRAVFPGGSITGAPKIRAMEIIDELEPTRRGPYTGAIGYYSRGGTSAFNIAIRTLLVEGDRVSFQVGGGIVADSDTDAEYHETLHKGSGLRDVLEGLAG
jgi:para-aminobenzoate synthetase component 1